MSFSILSKYLDAAVLNAIDHTPIEARELVEGNLAGAHRSPLSGFAVEFAGHREYVPGDDPRHIDWRVFYARDKTVVKQYELETNFVCNLLLDVSASMRYGEGPEQKLFFAQQMLALLAYRVIRQNDKVSLTTFDTEVREALQASNSFDQVLRVLQILDQSKPLEQTDFVASLDAATSRMGRREIVMIFSDFLTTDIERLEASVQRLRFQGHEVILFQVAHHDELTFNLKGMVRFEGLEEDDHLLVQSDDIRDNYLAVVAEFNQQLHDLALRNRAEHLLVDTSRSLGNTLLDYLKQRQTIATR